MVGAVVLAALGILAWMILQFAGPAADFLFVRGSRIVIVADRANGVAQGSSIEYLGVNVGHVMNIRIADDHQQVIIDAHINEGRQIPKNVRGVIRTTSALGGTANIGLETVGAPTDEYLAPGDVIEASGGGGGLIPPEFTELATEARQRQLVTHLDDMVVSIREQSEKLGRLVDSVNELVSDEQMRGDLRTSLTNIRTATEEANVAMKDFRQFSGTLDRTSRLLNDRLEQVGQTLERFQVVAAKMERGEGTLGMLTNDPRLYESLVDTARELSLTIRDLKRLVEQWEQEGVTFRLGK